MPPSWDTDRRPRVRLDRTSDRPGTPRPIRGQALYTGHRPTVSVDIGPDLTSGLCTTRDPEMMFVRSAKGIARAKALCAACPVQDLCLADALARGDMYGIRGGLTPHERQSLTLSTEARTLELEAS